MLRESPHRFYRKVFYGSERVCGLEVQEGGHPIPRRGEQGAIRVLITRGVTGSRSPRSGPHGQLPLRGNPVHRPGEGFGSSSGRCGGGWSFARCAAGPPALASGPPAAAIPGKTATSGSFLTANGSRFIAATARTPPARCLGFYAILKSSIDRYILGIYIRASICRV